MIMLKGKHDFKKKAWHCEIDYPFKHSLPICVTVFIKLDLQTVKYFIVCIVKGNV